MSASTQNIFSSKPMSIDALRKLLAARERELQEMTDKKSAIVAQLTDLHQQLKSVEVGIHKLERGEAPAATPATTGTSKPRAPRKLDFAAIGRRVRETVAANKGKPFRVYLDEVLRDASQPLTGKEIAARARALGYKTGVDDSALAGTVRDMCRTNARVDRRAAKGEETRYSLHKSEQRKAAA